MSPARTEIDIGFFRPQPGYPDNVETLVVLREPVMLVLHRDHPLAAGERAVAARELAGDPFIVPQADDAAGFARYAAAIAGQGGFRLRISHHVPDFIAVLNLVGLGFGVAAVPACLQRMQPAEVVYRPLADCEIFADLMAGFRTDERSPAVVNFVEILRRREVTSPS